MSSPKVRARTKKERYRRRPPLRGPEPHSSCPCAGGQMSPIGALSRPRCLTKVRFVRHKRHRTRVAPESITTRKSPQLAQERDQRLALLGVERRKRFPRDRERVRRGFFGHLLT